ncbi:hypothetical protein BHM03_00026255 [Ensete ventricosum]|nr:hypothetical protein BHM03_00026255 [Ensete ventricosum]
MVRAKVDGLGQGGGSYTTAEFLLDLLLLCTNVIVFHPKDSPESIAAGRLRDKVIKEISACVGPPTPSSRLPIEPTPPPTPDLDVTDSLPDKPTTAAPLIACRTRSSTSNMSEEVEEEKEETPKTEPEESVNEEKALEKKMNKETYVLSRKTRGLRTNKLRSGHAGEGPTAKRPSVAAVPNLKPRAAQNAAVVDAATTSHRKSDGSVASTAALEKQKRQDNSPNQIKRSSKGTVKETLKSSSSRGGGVGGKAVEIQMKRGKSNGGKDQRTRQGTGAIRVESATKKVADTSGPAKRSVGRPPKRAASPSTLLRPGKRARGHTEARATPENRNPTMAEAVNEAAKRTPGLMSLRSLEGKVVMVTGASSGIGRDLCLDLAKAGCRVIAAARRTDRLRSLCEEINGSGASEPSTVRSVAVELDVSADEPAIAASVQRAWDAFGRIDGLVNNAGVRGTISLLLFGKKPIYRSSLVQNLVLKPTARPIVFGVVDRGQYFPELL